MDHVPAEPEFDDLLAAEARLRGNAVRTPLLEAPLLNERLGGRVLVKAEVLQRTGSFKYRGAFNRIAMIDPDRRGRGVVAFSSGNHAQGVAAAARELGAPATIVMPADAPAIKVRNTRALGAEVVLYDRRREDREAIGARIAEDTGATLVRPFDDPGIIAGQGTAGLELVEQADAAGAKLDAVIVPCSGGGLAAGIALALSRRSPGTEVFAAEPEGYDDLRRSLEAGRRIVVQPDRPSICDALLSPAPGILTFPILARHLRGSLTVSDREAQTAMAAAFETLKIVLEPGGAVALAALLARRIDLGGRTVAVIASGGNADPETFAAALAGGWG